MPLEIRSARDQDSRGIAALVSEYAQEKGKAADSPAVADAVDRCIGDPGRIVLVAESGGQLAGYLVAHWIPFPMIGGTECYISDLIVSSSQRGSGIGRLLVAELEKRARKQGCSRLMLNNRIASASFQRKFYPKLGFRARDDFANLVKPL